MNENTNKELKGLCVLEDITDKSVRILKNRCFTLQNYAYDCYRSRDEQGIPYGNTAASILRFTIKLAQMDEYKFFYKKLKSNESDSVSFVFNAIFDDNQVLSSYDSALTVKGFIIDLKEKFQSKSENQVELVAEFLLKGIVYVGWSNNKELAITQ